MVPFTSDDLQHFGILIAGLASLFQAFQRFLNVQPMKVQLSSTITMLVVLLESQFRGLLLVFCSFSMMEFCLFTKPLGFGMRAGMVRSLRPGGRFLSKLFLLVGECAEFQRRGSSRDGHARGAGRGE